MHTAIIAILFVMLCFNPAIAISQWLGFMSIERNQRLVKIVQTANAVATIALFVLAVKMS